MIARPKKVKLSTLRNKCDRKLQEVGRGIYNKCMVCGGEYSCLHHVFPKGRSSTLRYCWDNCIPLCAGCHLSHHTGDPRIHNEAVKIKGQEWFDRLEWRHNNELVKPSQSYYREILDKLGKIG
jgi:5-methylcytosine-specific restriction endonuclease McrA